jgi:hypothetical protein
MIDELTTEDGAAEAGESEALPEGGLPS